MVLKNLLKIGLFSPDFINLTENQPMNTVIASGQSFNAQPSLRGKATAAEAIQKPTSLEIADQKILSKSIFPGLPRSHRSLAMTTAQPMKTSVGQAPPDNSKKHAAFSLVEMLMALLVASLLMAALAPVMTKKINENVGITVEGSIPGKKAMKHTINYNDDNCSEIDSVNNVCKGSFTVPNGFNGAMYVTATGAGGGGGASATTGSVEFTTAGTHTFKVPEGVDEIEVTLVEGGGGGGAGYIKSTNDDIKGYAWTFSGTLDRTYVPETVVNKNIKNVKVSGSSTAQNQKDSTGKVTYSHGTATLSGNDTKYIAGGKVFVTMAGGGGGGGRGTVGTGGGAGAVRKREVVSVTNGTAYTITLGPGGKGHSCGLRLGDNANWAGCGGSASTFGGLLTAGGGGGGAWGGVVDTGGNSGSLGTPGENGGAAGIAGAAGSCIYPDVSNGMATTGGYGASPGGGNGASKLGCGGSVAAACLFGSNGGANDFSKGGVFAITSSNNRHGQGYGAGGCGGGVHYCKTIQGYDIDAAGPNFTGDGAPGFVAAEWYEIANGGAGGGGASMAVKQRIKVFPGEILTVVVGEGGKGGKAAVVNGIGNVTSPANGESGRPSILKRGDKDLLYTSLNQRTPGTGCSHGACGGNAFGDCVGTQCSAGWIYTGWDVNGTYSRDGSIQTYEAGKNLSSNSKWPGYTAQAGYSAGQHTYSLQYTGDLTISDTGGNGGQTTIDNKQYCTRGLGSKTMGQKGGNATGYGGCGGGGGYGLSDGGDGASGYAKITWNPDKKGAGGGGGSGNTIEKRLITVRSGSVIKYQIGKGGDGGSIAGNNTVENNLNGTAFNNGQKGGDTIFGINSLISTNNYKIAAGGGYGGHSPIVTGSSGDISSIMMAHGTGGNKADICKVIDTLLICKGALDGESGSDTKGGDGANSKFGEGGKGASGNTGRNSDTIGAGGGGSGVIEVNSAFSNNSLGGKGGNGQITLEWSE